MSEEKYFEREYNYLQIAGEEFAQRHQSIGGMLRLSEKQRKDPFVERLMEAFAFLCGRVHERLDDDMPEFTRGLLEQLFPHFLRPFPSCAILQVLPNSGAITKAVPIARHSEVQTPTGRYKVEYMVSTGPSSGNRTEKKEERAEFIFRTTQDMHVRPLKLREARVENTVDATSELILKFQLDRNVSYEDLEMDRFPLYLNGPPRQKYTLLNYFCNHLKTISMRELANNDAPFVVLPDAKAGVAELNDNIDDGLEHDLIPYARQVFKGYRLLQEYFAYPERFFFIDVIGLHRFEALEENRHFEIRFEFDRELAGDFEPGEKDIVINCVPVVNLFQRPTEEVSITQRMPEYHIIPDIDRRKSREIYAVTGVEAVSEDRQAQFSYSPVTSYDILDNADPDHLFRRFYSTVYRPLRGDMGVTAIRLFGPALEEEEFPKETLSIHALQTNGHLPHSKLQPNSITEPVDFPQGVSVKNISVPSEVLQVPDEQNFLWQLISHLTLSFTTLADTDTLKSVLSLYNWSPSLKNPNHKKIREGILKVHPPQNRNLYRNRGLVRGIEYRIDIDPQYFELGEGDIYLFGSVLRKFLSQYITINSFVLLTIVETETDRVYTWEADSGKILPV